MAYKSDLAPGVTLPPGFSVDVSSARYKEFEAMATRHGLTQEAFSETLAIEAKRVAAEHERARAAAPAPAPAKPALPANWDRLSTREQMAYSLANSPGRKRLG